MFKTHSQNYFEDGYIHKLSLNFYFRCRPVKGTVFDTLYKPHVTKLFSFHSPGKNVDVSTVPVQSSRTDESYIDMQNRAIDIMIDRYEG